jgi:site-specific recombinase XerD
LQIILPETVRAKLKKFYRWKRQEGQTLSPDAPLFMSRKNNRLSARQVRHAFKKWQERAGFDRSFQFHSLRHCAITSIYERTKNILVAQRFARHRSITSTQIYMHPSDETLTRAVQDLLC